MAVEKTTAWRPMSDKPEKPCAALLLCSNRTWNDMDGNPASFGPVRDFAERVEVAFFEGGEWWQANTGHSVFNDFRDGDDLPTHWIPIQTLEDQP